MKTLEELEAENTRLKKEIRQICNEFYRVFTDEPDENGLYPHMGICSASRRRPIGGSGCVCKGAPIFKRAKVPHDFSLTEQVRPEQMNGDGWDNFQCSKCKWTTGIFVDVGDEPVNVDWLNSHGWCPEEEI